MRRSWDTDMRNCRWVPCARARLAAIWFTELARETSSGPSCAGTGTLASRSPAGDAPGHRLRSAAEAGRCGGPSGWPRSRPRSRAAAMRWRTTPPAAPTPSGASRVSTTTRLWTALRPAPAGRREGGPCQAPRWPLTGRSLMRSGLELLTLRRSAGHGPLGSPIGPGVNRLYERTVGADRRATASPCSCEGRLQDAQGAGAERPRNRGAARCGHFVLDALGQLLSLHHQLGLGLRGRC